MPVISCMLTSLRRPSDRRAICTTAEIAELICWRIAPCGMVRPAMPIMFSSRASASRGVLACTVAIEPSWPVFMACSMSKRLGAAHLAQDDAVGPHAQRVAHQRALVHLALALDVGRAGLQPHHVRLLQLQLGRVLDGDDALVVRDERRQDVQQRRLAGAGAARDQDVELGLAPWPPSSSAIAGVSDVLPIRLSIFSGTTEKRRIDSSGPSSPAAE
jgi:hypothetical protein